MASRKLDPEHIARCCNCGRKRDVRKFTAGQCGSCRSTGLRRKHTWTPEMDELLRKVYMTAAHKTDLTLAITHLASRFRMPRYIIQNRAQYLGFRIREQKLWTEAELDLLCHYSGLRTTAQIARILGRTVDAVKHKMFSLKISAELCEGFSQNELGRLCGVNHTRIGKWIGRGWIQFGENGMISHDSVVRFVWEHMDELRFAACEEWWLKQMLKAFRALPYRAPKPQPVTEMRKTA